MAAKTKGCCAFDRRWSLRVATAAATGKTESPGGEAELFSFSSNNASAQQSVDQGSAFVERHFDVVIERSRSLAGGGR